MKKIVLAILMTSLMLATVLSVLPVSAVKNNVSLEKEKDHLYALDDDYDHYDFEDVDIIVFGRCRDFGDINEWAGGLHIGHLNCVGVATSLWKNGMPLPFTKLNVIIKDSSGIKFSKMFMRGSIHADDANGTFYLAKCLGSAALIAPHVYINCHAFGEVRINVRK